jgi:hypothetical protein
MNVAAERVRAYKTALGLLVSILGRGVAGAQVDEMNGRAYSHRIPLAGLKCVSEKRRLELVARLECRK